MNAYDPVALTQTLVRMDTVNQNGQGNEAACSRHLAELLGSVGFECHLSEFGERRMSLVARIGNRSHPALAFTGHVDTVPLGAMPWSRDPFGGEIADGRLYGRGSSDMKSGIAAFIAAALETAVREPSLVFIITAGEESGCEGAFHLTRAPEFKPLLEGVGALVVAEPTENRPIAAHKGAFWLRAHAKGISAHGSMPERGDNAIYKLAEALVRLRDYDFGIPPHPLMGRPTLNVGLIAGGLAINSVPDEANFTLDIRSVAGQDHAAIGRDLSALFGSDIALETLIDMASIYTDPQDPWMRRVMELAAPGEKPGSVTYFTDAAVLRPALGNPPTVILGPGEAHRAHQTDEYCLVERIGQAKELYRQIIEDWASYA